MAFRYPKGAVDVKALRRYLAGQSLDVSSKGADVVVTMSVERDDFDAEDDGQSWLASLIALRADIANGDERVLYLGWLLGVQQGQIDDDVPEPARPEGLWTPSPALESFIDIMGLDRDLVGGRSGRPSKDLGGTTCQENRPMDCRSDTDERVALLSRVSGGEAGVGVQLIRRFRRHATGLAKPPLRTAGTLRARAEEFAEQRRRGTVARETKERKRRDRERAAARERHLTTLAKRQGDAWRRVEALVITKRPGDYVAGVTLLKDLCEIGDRGDRSAEVAGRIRALREVHAKKRSFLARLKKAGF